MPFLLTPWPGIFAGAVTMISPLGAQLFQGVRKYGGTGKVYNTTFTDEDIACEAGDAGHTIQICTGPWIEYRPRVFEVTGCGTPPPTGVWNHDDIGFTDNNEHYWNMGNGVPLTVQQILAILLAHYGHQFKYAIRWSILWTTADIPTIRSLYTTLHYTCPFSPPL